MYRTGQHTTLMCTYLTKINTNKDLIRIQNLWQIRIDFFGIITDVSGITSGLICTGITSTDSVSIAEQRGTDGRVINLAAYSVDKSVSLDGVWTGNIAPGSKITLNGTAYLVENATKTQSNEGFVQGSLSLKTADSAVLSSITDTAV